MRKNIFLNAWNLVRTFSITLSEALVISWKEFKLEVVAEKINSLDLKLNAPEVREEVKFLNSIARELNIALKSIKPSLNVAFNNSGASLHYDGKTFNND
mgnify:CR=1 FL=1